MNNKNEWFTDLQSIKESCTVWVTCEGFAKGYTCFGYAYVCPEYGNVFLQDLVGEDFVGKHIAYKHIEFPKPYVERS